MNKKEQEELLVGILDVFSKKQPSVPEIGSFVSHLLANVAANMSKNLVGGINIEFVEGAINAMAESAIVVAKENLS